MATPAARALRRACRALRLPAARAGVFAAAWLIGAAAAAQTLYKYKDAAGHWVFSDRHPPGRGDLIAAYPAAAGEPLLGVRLREGLDAAGEPVLLAVNAFESWAQIAWRVEASRNLDPDARMAGNSLLPPGSETPLMTLGRIDGTTPAEVSFSYQYLLGHPGARHRPAGPYRLPFAPAEAHRVSQAYPDAVTHKAPADRHAVDFEMAVGTPVLAAREGIVIEVVDAFQSAGLDLEQDGHQANLVRILHADGTLALYGHLSLDSIRVAPGQRIERGEHIADSGNTGFSSGPHLHFVVQRNRAGAVESVPVVFAGGQGNELSLRTGDRPVAY